MKGVVNMADKVTKKVGTEAEPTETKATVQAKTETKKAALYSIDDLAKAEKKLNANRVVIRTALKKEGEKMYSLDEATTIVKKFKEREVK